jgi:hypothetical protein
VGSGAVLDTVVRRKIPSPPAGIEPYNPDCPARSPELYRLNYHGSESEYKAMLKGYRIIASHTDVRKEVKLT